LSSKNKGAGCKNTISFDLHF